MTVQYYVMEDIYRSEINGSSGVSFPLGRVVGARYKIASRVVLRRRRSEGAEEV